MIASHRRRTRAWIALWITLLTVMITGVATTSIASWTTAVTVTGTVTTTRVAITQQGFGALSATYLNSSINPLAAGFEGPGLASTGVFTVTNTGTAAGVATITLTAGTGTLGTALNRTIWPVSQSTDCTPQSAVGSAISTMGTTWASGGSFATGSLAAGASAIYCVRSSADRTAVANTNGTRTVSANLSATLSAAGWTTAPVTDTLTLNTAAVYPLTATITPDNSQLGWMMLRLASDPATCLQMDNDGGVGGSVNVGPCRAAGQTKPYTRSIWQLTGAIANNTVLTMRPGTATTARLAAAAGGSVSPAAANSVLGAGGSAQNQRWFVQERQAQQYQLVSMLNGKCLGLVSGAGRLVECTDPAVVVLTTPEAIAPSAGLGLLGLNISAVLDIGAVRATSTAPGYKVQIANSANPTTWNSCVLLGLTQAVVQPGSSSVSCVMLLTAGQANYIRVTDSGSDADIIMQFVAKLTCTNVLTLVCSDPTVEQVRR
jgi:hypothetical protein